MGEHASRVQSLLRERLATSCPRFDWQAEYDLDGTPVDIAGVSESTLVLVELEWRRADPVDNTATLFRHLTDGVLAAPPADAPHGDTVVVVQLFTAYYDLVRGGVSSKRQNAEFVGDRLAGSFPHVSYRGLLLSVTPPRADGALPEGWQRAVDTVVADICDIVDRSENRR